MVGSWRDSNPRPLTLEKVSTLTTEPQDLQCCWRKLHKLPTSSQINYLTFKPFELFQTWKINNKSSSWSLFRKIRSPTKNTRASMGQALIGCCPVATANQSSPHSGPILSSQYAICAISSKALNEHLLQYGIGMNMTYIKTLVSKTTRILDVAKY